MFMFQNKLTLAGILVAAVVFGMANPTRADILLNLTDVTSGGSTGNITSTSDFVSFTGAVGYFTVAYAAGKSNSPGGPYNAIAQQSTVFITNNYSTTATLSILVSSNDFTSPATPPFTLYDVVNGTTASGPSSNPGNISVSGTAQGFASSSNLLGDTSGVAGTALSFQASGPSTNFSPAPGGTMSGNVTVTSLSTPYSLTFIETFTLSAGGSLTVTDGNVQIMAPEPASMVMVFSAMPLLGLGYWLRRRQSLLQAAA